MVINLEVPLEQPGQYAVHVERSFLITGDGVVALTSQDRSHAFVAGARP